MKKSYLIFFITAAVLIALDQLTKALVASNLQLHDSVPLINGFLNLVHVRNPGAAFGFLAKAPDWFRSVFFITVTIGAILLILYYLKQTAAADQNQVVALSFIFAGAVGNLIDRVRFGEVIDFIDVYVSSHHWPAFNVADSAISAGAVLLVISLLKRPQKKEA
ncbi:MAG: signal peptidase II [Syntrophaceae bacterium]